MADLAGMIQPVPNPTPVRVISYPLSQPHWRENSADGRLGADTGFFASRGDSHLEMMNSARKGWLFEEEL